MGSSSGTVLCLFICFRILTICQHEARHFLCNASYWFASNFREHGHFFIFFVSGGQEVMYCTLERPDLLHPWSWNLPSCCRETACIKVKLEATGNSPNMHGIWKRTIRVLSRGSGHGGRLSSRSAGRRRRRRESVAWAAARPWSFRCCSDGSGSETGRITHVWSADLPVGREFLRWIRWVMGGLDVSVAGAQPNGTSIFSNLHLGLT